MKHLFLFIAAASLITACKKSSPGETNPEQTNPAPSEVIKAVHGTLTGAQVTASIGAAGGSLQSIDGHLKLTIPAGAVANTTHFTIQPVTSVLEGTGPVYRIGPENVVFTQPVTIEYNYSGIESMMQNKASVFPAYQDTAGVFFQPKNIVADTAHNKLIISTRHFSDWTIYRTYDLITPGRNPIGGFHNLRENEILNLELRCIATMGDPNAPQNSDIKIAYKKDRAINLAQWDYAAKTGILNVFQTERKATYQAPAVFNIPRQVVNVFATLNGDLGKDVFGHDIHQLILIQIAVLSTDNYFELTIDGHTSYLQPGEYAADISNGFGLRIFAQAGVESIDVSTTLSSAGNQPFGVAGTPGNAYMTWQSPQESGFQSFRQTDCTGNTPGLTHSQGSVNIRSFALQPGQYTEGVITASLYRNNYCDNPGNKSVKAVFRIRK